MTTMELRGGEVEEDGKKTWPKVKSKVKSKVKAFDIKCSNNNSNKEKEEKKEVEIKDIKSKDGRKNSKDVIVHKIQPVDQTSMKDKYSIPKKSPRRSTSVKKISPRAKSSDVTQDKKKKSKPDGADIVKELLDKTTTTKPSTRTKKRRGSNSSSSSSKHEDKTTTKKKHTKKKSTKSKSPKEKKTITEAVYTADLGVIDQLLDGGSTTSSKEDLLYTTDIALNDDDMLVDEEDEEDDDEEESDHPRVPDSGAYTSDDVDFVPEENTKTEQKRQQTRTNYEDDLDSTDGNFYTPVFELSTPNEDFGSSNKVQRKPSVTFELPLYTEDLDAAPYEEEEDIQGSRQTNSSGSIKKGSTHYTSELDGDAYSMYEASGAKVVGSNPNNSKSNTNSSEEDENLYTSTSVADRYTDIYEEKQQRKALLYSTNIPKSISHYTEGLDLLPGYSDLAGADSAKGKKQKSKPIEFTIATPIKNIASDEDEKESTQKQRKQSIPPLSEMINSSDLTTLKYLLTEIVKTTEIDNDSPSIPIDTSIIQSKFISILGSSSNSGILEDGVGQFKIPTDERPWVTEWFSAWEKMEGWKVYAIEQDFKFLATSTAKTIIREIPLPVHQKTIKPVNIGGVAGGSKYVKNGIIYKLATDVNLGNNTWMYGGENGASDEYAIKAAGRELDGLNAFITASLNTLDKNSSSPIVPLRFPLMILIDYCGYRVIAMSLLPILGKDSLVYGSCDGGASVKANNSVVNKHMEKIGEALGLAAHSVGGKSIIGPGDFEIHRSSDPKTDANFYALDFARLMPPEAPSPIKSIREKEPRSVFYKLLRPALVANWSLKNNSRGLSSDAFTGWGKDDPNRIKQCQDVISATKYLYDDFIPKLVRNFYNSLIWSSYVRWRTMEDAVQNPAESNIDLEDEAKFYLDLSLEFMVLTHSSGINFRHLGKIRKVIQTMSTGTSGSEPADIEFEQKKKQWMEELVMSVIVARGLKNIIKQEFRSVFSERLDSENSDSDDSNERSKMYSNTKSPSSYYYNANLESEQPYKEIVVKYFNLLFNFKSSDIKTSDFWSKNNYYNFKHFLSERYRELFISPTESSDETDLRSLCNLKIVFIYLSHLLGTVLKQPLGLHSIWETFSTNKHLNIQRILFFKTDVVAISERVRSAGFADLITGIKAFGDFFHSHKQYTKLERKVNFDYEEEVRKTKSLDYATNSLNAMFLSHPTCPLTNLYSGIAFYYSSKMIKEVETCRKKWYLLQAINRLEYSVFTAEMRGEANKYRNKAWRHLKKLTSDGFIDWDKTGIEIEEAGGKGGEPEEKSWARNKMEKIWQGNRNWELFSILFLAQLFSSGSPPFPPASSISIPVLSQSIKPSDVNFFKCLHALFLYLFASPLISAVKTLYSSLFIACNKYHFFLHVSTSLIILLL
eukprot:TRINITY_DN1620_c0_g1_i1.p1 TRINITY_DN1620_c0_g1~~TRINITY_DN1620_c0_g1_i1.p1  ORF type:complete len:1408 (+),score=358.44 TRINITY_DN1620_c0_g1_i1:236-4459(+)